MPPFIGSKRLRDDADDADEQSPAHAPPSKRARVVPAPKPAPPKKTPARVKQTLSESLDSDPTRLRSIADRRNQARQDIEDEEESSSSGSESAEDSDDFEDVTTARSHRAHYKHYGVAADDDESGSDEEMEFEDAVPGEHKQHRATIDTGDERNIGDISITLSANGTTSVPDEGLAFTDARGVVGKKGPSKIERQIRQNTHCMHVQFLMFHNTIRNAWLQDKQVQDTLVKQLPQQLKNEVTRWHKALGGKNRKITEDTIKPAKASRGKGKSKARTKPTVQRGDDDDDDESALKDLIPTRNEYDQQALRDRIRDWGADAEPLEVDEPDLSHGDPTIRLLRFLAAYWRKRFFITAPSLHKRGYLGPKDLETHTKAWAKEPDDEDRFGERITSREQFRLAAKKCQGSRDVGAQLFTALLRGVGLQARMIVSLQPVGFGFGKVEDGVPYKKTSTQSKAKEKDHAAFTPSALKRGIDMKKKVRKLEQTRKVEQPTTRKSTRGSTNTAPISLDTSSSDELSDAPSDISDDPSIVDVTPSRKPARDYNAPPNPTYWTEVLSPITHSFIPVLSLPQPVIANSADLLASFTPSGKAAEKAKQVLAYVVAYSSDGTAKDVTVRYLKKKQWPGKTRGVRVAKDKLPIYNKRGKVKKWIEWDWFKEVMSGYTKDPRLRSPAEKMEDEVDLVPVTATIRTDEDAEPGKGNVGGKPESLQAYKNSAEYVLERHLRREEAILPHAQPVRHFTTGKADAAKSEPVYRRADIVVGMTVESWHKQGRAVHAGEQPIKMVPIRAVTLIRKREVEDAARETGEKPMQGLYAEDQTDWIIPDPIGPDRRIPKNAFGNIDVYVRSMVPAGAVHVRLKGCAKLCRKLEIDFAEAVTGFEFGKQRAVPVITGVVVAQENEGLVKDAWRVEQERVKERDRLKKQAACLGLWKKMLSALKVLERMQGDYGHLQDDREDEVNPWMNKKAREQKAKATEVVPMASHLERQKHEEHDGFNEGDAGGGGFFPEGMTVEEVRPTRDIHQEVEEDDEIGGGFLVDDDTETETSHAQRNGENVTNGNHANASPLPKLSRQQQSAVNKFKTNTTQLDDATDTNDSASRAPPLNPKKADNSDRSTSRKKAGLSKRVAQARKFESDTDDPDNAGTVEAADSPSPSESSEQHASSEEPDIRDKRRKISGRASKPVAKKDVRKSTRAAPKRKAASGVRSRYFESDDATATD